MCPYECFQEFYTENASFSIILCFQVMAFSPAHIGTIFSIFVDTFLDKDQTSG